MLNINTQQQNIVDAMMEKGLKAAAERLSFFMKDDIQVSWPIQWNEPSSNEAYIYKYIQSEQNIHVLNSPIIGNLKGSCCLIFNEQDADQLRSKALPSNLEKGSKTYLALKDAILLEVDNILTASVITEIANELNTSVYGGVPELSIMDSKALITLIKDHESNHQYTSFFRATFSSPSTVFTPVFAWFFDQIFLDSVKS